MSEHSPENGLERGAIAAAAFAAAVPVRFFLDEVNSHRDMLQRMQPHVELMGTTATQLQGEIQPFMANAMKGVRSATPNYSLFPESAVREAKLFTSGLDISTSATRWGFLSKTHQDLGNFAESAKTGMWRSSPELLGGSQLDFSHISAATRNSFNIQSLVDKYNESAAKIAAIKQAAEAGRTTNLLANAIRNIPAVLTGQGANFALDRFVLDKQTDRKWASIVDLVGTGAVLSSPLGFVPKVAAQIAVHLGGRQIEDLLDSTYQL